MLLEQNLNDPLCKPVELYYRHWFRFMERNVDYWMAESQWHAMDHAARVLLLALTIGHQKGVDENGLNTLSLAAVFHDSRRVDDWIDRGHGARAAEYYQAYCRTRSIPVDGHAAFIMQHHDLDDGIGLAEIDRMSAGRKRCLALFRIFKDADALDRFRLGRDALNVSMLRTNEAPELIAFSQFLLQQSRDELNVSRPAAGRTVEVLAS
ncbi:HD domain-containing protein [Herbaspirillum huttiense]|uniref:HD domain-containing protein n=2 Tax=Herbaspirillum huttiense TaxID=863372 RepID=A0AAJ2LRG4_9BURK|nr:HD domain-containing protein [Herbaspirillum huttiense]MDR9836747.1 HD domain-containing protein [Herbaspirillum huttiense]